MDSCAFTLTLASSIHIRCNSKAGESSCSIGGKTGSQGESYLPEVSEPMSDRSDLSSTCFTLKPLHFPSVTNLLPCLREGPQGNQCASEERLPDSHYGRWRRVAGLLPAGQVHADLQRPLLSCVLLRTLLIARDRNLTWTS